MAAAVCFVGSEGSSARWQVPQAMLAGSFRAVAVVWQLEQLSAGWLGALTAAPTGNG
jgi:hypothetical protein